MFLNKKGILFLLLGLIVTIVIFFTFKPYDLKEGMYSNEIDMNVSYQDSGREIPNAIDFEYTALSEEKFFLPIHIDKEGLLKLNYDINTDNSSIFLTLKDVNNKESYSIEVIEGKETELIPLPEGKYELTLIMNIGSGSGKISWEGIENDY